MAERKAPRTLRVRLGTASPGVSSRNPVSASKSAFSEPVNKATREQFTNYKNF